MQPNQKFSESFSLSEGGPVNEALVKLPIEKRLDDKQVDPSMLTDYDSVFDTVQQIRMIPSTIRDVIGMAIPLIIPFLPLLLIHFSVVELLQKIMKLLV